MDRYKKVDFFSYMKVLYLQYYDRRQSTVLAYTHNTMLYTIYQVCVEIKNE